MAEGSNGTLVPAPTHSSIPFRPADFSNLADALDYAAQGEAGLNFYDGRGKLAAVRTFTQLRAEAQAHAHRMQSLGLDRGARVALIAETSPEFIAFFFACQYIGAIPVPLPVHVGMGKRDFYVHQLRCLLENSTPDIVIASTETIAITREAASELPINFIGTPTAFSKIAMADAPLEPSRADEPAYIQYTSGSTQMPRGVVMSEAAVLANLQGIVQHGLCMNANDRMLSWLPFYHDMGLVGLVLVPVASQTTVDYLATSTFAMRPRLWLELLSRTQATISYSPPFGYELCARRVGKLDVSGYDLSHWRVAGVGAEMIRSETLHQFAEALAPAGFRESAFVACYGMAEHALAITFADLDQGVLVDSIDRDHHAATHLAVPPADDAAATRGFVNCGKPLPGHEIQIRDTVGHILPDRVAGRIFVRGSSVMTGYFNEAEMTRECLSEDGWLDTGDLGYTIGDDLVLTGRSKDLIIAHGRNIWPQDLEFVAEQQPGIRTNDALAFKVVSEGFDDTVVLIIQCREKALDRRERLVAEVRGIVRAEFGIDVHVVLVAPHTLPRTSSGKLSRSRARLEFLDSEEWESLKVSAA